MNRVWSRTGGQKESEDHGGIEQHRLRPVTPIGQLTPPVSPVRVPRPSKFRQHGSKLVSALRSLTNSGTETTPINLPPDCPSPPQRFSINLLKGQLEPTVVHRTQFKNRPSLISLGEVVHDIILDISPSTSAESSNNSGKSSVPPAGASTRKTSFDSKFSSKLSQHSSENKKTSAKQSIGEGGSNENILSSIPEIDGQDWFMPVPTFVTVEKAASTKIFFETHYNHLTCGALSPRSLRRQQLEIALYHDVTMSPAEKDEKRRAWARDESDHLRETRVLKAQSSNIPRGQESVGSNYEVVHVLGKGSFGVVRLVREKTEKDTSQAPSSKKQIYAMKVIRKSDMLRNSQEGHLRAERDFLVAAEGSRWVIPLITSFQDMNNLYLVMDYMPGGDFLGLLIRDNVLSEPVTKWYIAEMILCIEEAHSLRWIHRDVKPDNFLISASGHLKISDFGLAFDGHWSHDQAYYNNHRYSLLAKLGIEIDGDSIDRKEGRSFADIIKTAAAGPNRRHQNDSSNESDSDGILNWRNRCGNRALARSVVGTSQYMAPEVVRGELYDARCDWWSVAIILYECLYGHTPFLAEEGGRAKTKQNICEHTKTFSFPHKPMVSKKCQDLIRCIIQEKEDRLCSRRYKMKGQGSSNLDHCGRYVYPNDAEDIKSHKWFRDIQWDRLHQMIPPFVPNIKSMDDTHYFDEEEPISDFSDSISTPAVTPEEISDALKPFHPTIQLKTAEFLRNPHDTASFRKMEREIETFMIAEEQKEYLKAFVKHYGRKEKKRPRDRLLRDKVVAPKVLELRKRGAFLGYTYRRYRPRRDFRIGTVRQPMPASMGKRTVFHRARLSIY